MTSPSEERWDPRTVLLLAVTGGNGGKRSKEESNRNADEFLEGKCGSA